MTLTPRQIEILKALRRYFYLRTAQIRDLVIPADKDGSITRECLRGLLRHEFVRRHEPRILEQGKTTAPPIYILTLAGSCALATQSGDCGFLLTIEPTFRDWLSLHHFCALSSLHMTIDAAIAAQTYVKQHALYFEHEVMADSEDPAKKYKLYVRLSNGAIKCCPDSAFEVEIATYRRAYYVEREMGSDTPGRAAGKKHKGFAELARTKSFQRHFPQARDFRVLAVCPHAGWRDAMRREMKGKAGQEFWLFCSVTDVTPDTFLHEPIFYTTDKGPLPFVPAPAALSAGGGSAGGSAGGRK